MAEDRQRNIRLQLELSPHQPELLEGLNHWLQLGLITDEQVRNLCRQQLSCKLPPVRVNPLAPRDAAAVDSSPAAGVTFNPFAAARAALAAEASPGSDRLANPEAPNPETIASTPAPSPPASTRSRGLGLTRLMNELSVVWLLGLGVFLVVLSSAVLAATQWARFNAVGQYLVLLAYTLVFWAMGLWCSRNDRLQLTARTLQMVTLLLVPLNFWALDGLQVWGTTGGFLVASLAALVLTLAVLQVMGRQQAPWIQQANVLVLAYLHTGWGLATVPVLAMYGGVLGSAAAMVVAEIPGSGGTVPGSSGAISLGDGPSGREAAGRGAAGETPGIDTAISSRRWATLGVFFALGLLLLRGLTVLPGSIWGQLGLAFGLYGATWVWLAQRRLGAAPATQTELGRIWLGRGLLGWGWLMAIGDFRAQAFGVSGLGLGLRLQALQKLGRRRDLLGAYGIAVQLAFVGWQLVPEAMRQAIMTPLSPWAKGSGGHDFALVGVSLFPYVVAMVAVADRYLRQGHLKLGRCSDVIALGSAVLLTLVSLFSPGVLVVNLIAATITALVVTWRRIPPRPWRFFFSYGLALATIMVALDHRWPTLAAPRWMAILVGLMALLWAIWRWLPPSRGDRQTRARVDLYRTAADTWGHLLAVGLLGFMSVALAWLYLDGGTPEGTVVAAQVGFLGGLGLRYWGRVEPVAIYLAGWALELLLAQGLAWGEATAVSLAVPTLALGAVALALATLLPSSRPSLISSLQTLTGVYGGLAVALRTTTVTAWTGWIVVGAALLLLEVGRRNGSGPLRWLALLGLSAGWYELVLYRLWQADGGAAVDGVIVLATVAAVIMIAYRLAATRLDRYWQFPPTELIWAAHIHWGVGSLFMLGVGIAMASTPADLAGVGLVTALALVIYALLQGRLGPQSELKSAWVYAGLGELVGWFTLLRLALPVLQGLDNWWGAVACVVAIPVYWIPWSRQGWPQRPWRVMAVAVPLVITGLTQGFDHIPSLWILAGFYGWLAWHSRRIQVSYLSVGCGVWAIWVWLEEQGIQDSLAFVLPLGLALLYLAQVDPHLSQPAVKGTRHWLRLLAVSMILLTALGSQRWTGWPVGLMGLGAIAAGLGLRTRAFLYGGTGVFILNALNQLIVLNATYPFIKWVVGILVGIGLIWIAADFERRRDQWLSLTQTWTQDLNGWQ
jgi:hypothetical protein